MGKRRSAPTLAGTCALLLAACGAAVAGVSPPVQREGVLGTSFEMQVAGADAQAQGAVEAALAEIERLERQLSTWREDSALSAYNAGRIEAERLPEDVVAELPRWWRHYGRDDPAGAQGIARPTRAPGQYAVAWDGRDDLGRAEIGRIALRHDPP